MYKAISNILISIALVMLGVTLFAPDFTDKVTDRVLDTLVSEETVPSIKSLVPSEVTSYIRTIRPAISTTGSFHDKADITMSGIVDATNAERIEAGLSPLQVNTKLIASATIKTNDMIDLQYFEHNSPGGKGVSDLGRQVGYDYVVMGENLALGNFTDSADVVTAWMQSPGHRANILNPNYQEIGVYAAHAQYQGRDVWFAVQHFGTARSVCPGIDTNLKKTIDTMNTDLKAKQIQITNEKARLETPNRPGGEEYRAEVEAFNKLVAQYNTTLVISQEQIKEYNAQVSAFNTCLVQYQK